MKTLEIREGVRQHMTTLGVPDDLWTFDRGRAELILLIGGKVRKLVLKSGMTLREFTYAMGRVEGIWEASR